MMKKKIVVLTGAGVSAESGFATFRDRERIRHLPRHRRTVGTV